MRLLGVLLLATLASSKLLNVEYCPDVGSEKCVIDRIEILPCMNKKTCTLVRGNNASIEFDFTPKFSAKRLKTEAFALDLKWTDLDSDGCKLTTCPTQADQKQTYHVNIYLGKIVPVNTYTFTWTVFDEENPENKCCFIARTKLVKK